MRIPTGPPRRQCVTALMQNWFQSRIGALGCGGSLYSDVMATCSTQMRSIPLLQPLRCCAANSMRAGISKSSPIVVRPALAITTRPLSSSSKHRNNQRVLDFDTLLSVLESSATKRDARGYLQKYTSKEAQANNSNLKPSSERHQLVGSESENSVKVQNVAIVKLRAPQVLDDNTLRGLAKTLSQLRTLGLLSLVILDCGVDEPWETFQRQSFRFCEALDAFKKPSSRHVSDVVLGPHQTKPPTPSILGDQTIVDDLEQVKHTLQSGMIPVIPSLSRQDDTYLPRPADANQVTLTLTKYLTGMQFSWRDIEQIDSEVSHPTKTASVERIIILDPLGGTPVPGRPGASHRFVNLEQEYDSLLKHLMGPEGSPVARKDLCTVSTTVHTSILHLAKEALSILPSTSSALVTTPHAAASSHSREATQETSSQRRDIGIGFNGVVTTRTRRNPLLHNLLTDKPVYSSSLPFQRIEDTPHVGKEAGSSSAATLIKRGMPLTIYPDTSLAHWCPPSPDRQRLRLTDSCIDLPRLVHLIEDSFGRKLDVQDYLERVNENLAGVIVAGEYEGGAILTWEIPEGLDRETAYAQGRLVPYLDKFAVLRSRQGSGGVADIVFNAMVNSCFPQGVCWRSRKDNPVNKWYFDRSAGTLNLSDSNWAMFWTTPGLLESRSVTLGDYEHVCRAIEPSWADNKHILD